MKRSGRKAVAALTAFAMFALSGIALAAQENTVVNFGYDQNNLFFMWNVTSLDHEPYEEGSEEGEDTMDLEALLEACGLETPDDPTAYGYIFDGETIKLFELDEEGAFDPEGDPVDLGDCGGLTGGLVAGPAGQVNHGMFMKLFNSMYDGPNRGCLVSLIARSDLGKGDHQVKPAGDSDDSDESDEADEPTLTVEGNVTFTTLTAQCKTDSDDSNDEDDTDADSGRRGPPQHVLDKWGGEKPGKSGSAGSRP